VIHEALKVSYIYELVWCSVLC